MMHCLTTTVAVSCYVDAHNGVSLTNDTAKYLNIVIIIIFIIWLTNWGIVVFLIKTCNMNCVHEAL